jgi:hypothetical protein
MNRFPTRVRFRTGLRQKTATRSSKAFSLHLGRSYCCLPSADCLQLTIPSAINKLESCNNKIEVPGLNGTSASKFGLVMCTHRESHAHWLFAIRTHKMHQQAARSLLDAHGRRTRATTTRFTATPALLRSRCALRLLVTRPHGLYVNLAMRREYSSPGHTDSTSTMLQRHCVRLLRLLITTRKLVGNGFRDINN